MTIHAINWLYPAKMVCGVTSHGRQHARVPIEITCDGCALKVLRTGQRLGMDISKLDEWEWSEIEHYQPSV